MSQVSVGQGNNRDKNESHVPAATPGAKPGKTLGEFGDEGTNQTIPQPKPDGAPSEELGNAVQPKHVEKTPYTRG